MGPNQMSTPLTGGPDQLSDTNKVLPGWATSSDSARQRPVLPTVNPASPLPPDPAAELAAQQPALRGAQEVPLPE